MDETGTDGKATEVNEKDEPKSNTADEGSGKKDTSKKRNTTGEGSEEKQPLNVYQWEVDLPLLESMTFDDNQKVVAKAAYSKGNDEPKSKTAGEGTGKVDTSKNGSKTGEGNKEE